MGVPQHQLWRGIRASFNADVIIECKPLVAPACFKEALCGRVGDGWGHQETKVRRCYNMLCLQPDLMRATVNSMRCDLPWVALTSEKTLTEEAKAGLDRVGSKVFAWSKGAIEAASIWYRCKAQVRSNQSREPD